MLHHTARKSTENGTCEPKNGDHVFGAFRCNVPGAGERKSSNGDGTKIPHVKPLESWSDRDNMNFRPLGPEPNESPNLSASSGAA